LVVRTFRVLVKLLLDLARLLHERLDDRVFLLNNGLHLSLLISRQIQILGEKPHHVAHAKFVTMHRRRGRRVFSGLRFG